MTLRFTFSSLFCIEKGGISIEIFEIFQTKYNFIMIHRLSKIYSYRQPFLVFLSSSPFLRALKMIKFRNGPSDTRVPDWTFHPCDLNKRFARIFVPPRILGSLWCTLISIRNIYPQILKVVSPLAFLYIC